MSRPSSGTLPKWVDWALAQETDACIIWPFASVTPRGYPMRNEKRRMLGVHREVCERAHGAPPAGDYEAAHGCGVRLCCNKRHLRWATPKDNKADELVHGTRNRGARHGHAKLTREIVLAIRASDLDSQSLANSYGVAAATVRDARTGRTWAWL